MIWNFNPNALLTYPPALFPVPHHSCWEFCAANPAEFCWVVPSGPPSSPKLGGVTVMRLKTTGVQASLLSSHWTPPPAPYAPLSPAPPLRPPLHLHLPPLPGLLSWTLLKGAQDPLEPCPCHPPLLSHLPPQVGSHHHARRRSRRPHSLQLLLVVRSSRLSDLHSSCSCQEHNEAKTKGQNQIRVKQ